MSTVTLIVGWVLLIASYASKGDDARTLAAFAALAFIATLAVFFDQMRLGQRGK